jgi:Ran GTPase-activating protein (RanGAP) involved in mRNA processing and transport
LNENKRRKRVDVPEKYKNVLEDLKNDRAETIDFGGAELGDQVIIALCDYIAKSVKVRNLKLVRNKLTDEAMYDILSACFKSKITSLNLGQNFFTEKSFEMFEKYELGDIRNITLSLNKINRRNVKDRLEEFTKRGITMSI